MVSQSEYIIPFFSFFSHSPFPASISPPIAVARECPSPSENRLRKDEMLLTVKANEVKSKQNETNQQQTLEVSTHETEHYNRTIHLFAFVVSTNVKHAFH